MLRKKMVTRRWHRSDTKRCTVSVSSSPSSGRARIDSCQLPEDFLQCLFGLRVAVHVSPRDEAEGASDLSDAPIAVEFGAPPLMLSRNVDDGAKNKLPVTGLLKSSRRS
jgi:hypothetical protein